MAKSTRCPCLSRLSRAVFPLLIGLFLLITAAAAQATPEPGKWTRVPLPAEGAAGDWVLAHGSDIRHPVMAADGTLYAYAGGLTNTLYRSGDGGRSWSDLGDVSDEIVAIATVSDETRSIYYATASDVFRSTDGGATFQAFPAVPGAGSNNVAITSLAVTSLESNILAAGTVDADSGQFGGVYTLDEKDIIPSWEDTGLDSYDVAAVSFSPNYAADRQLVAVVTDETDTLVTSQVGPAGWGASIGNAILDRDNSGVPTSAGAAAGAAIAFPEDYAADTVSDTNVFFIAIDTGTGGGDVYKITGADAPDASVATDLNAGAPDHLDNLDITGLACRGNTAEAVLLAGAADSAQTYFSDDGGAHWENSRKAPTGGSLTYVLIPADDGEEAELYAATSGSESAFSVSRDNAVTWDQVSLIDTQLSSLVDLSPSPEYDRDATLFLLSYGGEHSLWRTADEGETWERVFSSALESVDSLSLVSLSPEYGGASQVVFLAGESHGRPAVWKSGDNGRSFSRRLALDPDSGSLLSIDTWAIVDDDSLFIGSYDGGEGLIYYSPNGGFYYEAGAAAGSQSLHDIALSPDYKHDGTILVGNTDGEVFLSDDGGSSFRPLPVDAAAPPLAGEVTVAFDPAFADNDIVYAASRSTDSGVHRFTAGNSVEWEAIDSTLPEGGTLDRLAINGDGTLYTVNTDADGGMERSLNPGYAAGATFETVTRGLSDGATLSGLWQHGNRLWSIDTTGTRLLTFVDTFTVAAALTSPANQTQGIGTLSNHTVNNITIDWEALSGATTYEWQLDFDTDFSSVPEGFEGTTQATSVRLPTLEPATRYYWRVRVSSPVSSPWSRKQSFTTNLDTEAVALKLESPTAGALTVPVHPIFQWDAITGADRYELLVSTDINFSNPSIVKIGAYALESTAWQSDVQLDYEATYYWKVRGINPSTHSPWSSVSAFTTEAAPPAALPPPPTAPGPTAAPQPVTSFSITGMEPPAPPLKPHLPPPLPPPAAPAPVISGEGAGATPVWVPYLIGALLLVIILLTLTLLVALLHNHNR